MDYELKYACDWQLLLQDGILSCVSCCRCSRNGPVECAALSHGCCCFPGMPFSTALVCGFWITKIYLRAGWLEGSGSCFMCVHVPCMVALWHVVNVVLPWSHGCWSRQCYSGYVCFACSVPHRPFPPPALEPCNAADVMVKSYSSLRDLKINIFEYVLYSDLRNQSLAAPACHKGSRWQQWSPNGRVRHRQ